MHTTKFNKSYFSIPPKAFNLIDVGLIFNELIFSVVDPKAFSIPGIDKAAIASSIIGKDDSIQAGLFPSYLLQCGLIAVGYYIDVDNSIVFENTKEMILPYATRPFSSFTRRAPKKDLTISTYAKKEDLDSEKSSRRARMALE